MSIQYLIDEQGHKTAVLIPIGEWEALQERIKSYEEEEEVLTAEDVEDRHKAYEELKRGEVLELKEAMKLW